jgi:hypothetical protein
MNGPALDLRVAGPGRSRLTAGQCLDSQASPAPGDPYRQYTRGIPSGALLRLLDPRHGGLARRVWCQSAKANSSNAAANRKVTGASTATS